MNLSERIKQMRKAQGLSLTDLATQSGISRGYLHLLERGENSPTLDMLEKLAIALKTSPGYLIESEMFTSLTDDECYVIALLRTKDYSTLLEYIASKIRSG